MGVRRKRQGVGIPGRWEKPADIVVVVQGRADLFEIVLATGVGGCFPDFLDGGHQQANQDGNDGDHHQQFNQGKTKSSHDRKPFQGGNVKKGSSVASSGRGVAVRKPRDRGTNKSQRRTPPGSQATRDGSRCGGRPTHSRRRPLLNGATNEAADREAKEEVCGQFRQSKTTTKWEQG